VLVHYLTFGELPAVDQYNRPLFAYGRIIHDQCERRAHYDAGRYTQEWGDEGHRRAGASTGWAARVRRRPTTARPCDGTSWPVKSGHGCIACASHRFWDTRSPFYDRLPSVPGFGADVSAGQIGIGITAAVAGATVVHGIASAVRDRLRTLPGASDKTPATKA
jgi:hydrogenase small subunit